MSEDRWVVRRRRSPMVPVSPQLAWRWSLPGPPDCCLRARPSDSSVFEAPGTTTVVSSFERRRWWRRSWSVPDPTGSPDRTADLRPSTGPEAQNQLARTAHLARLMTRNHAGLRHRLDVRWAGQGSNLRPCIRRRNWAPDRARMVAAVVTQNEQHVRYVQCGAVPVRSQNERTSRLAGCFEPSTAHSHPRSQADLACFLGQT
jgi:hypothetical protein